MGRAAVLGGLLAGITAVLLRAPAADAHMLTYGKAKRALQSKAYELERQSTLSGFEREARVTGMVRVSPHRYRAKARWTRESEEPCSGGCGHDVLGNLVGGTFLQGTPCSAKLSVRFRSGSIRLVVRVADSTCKVSQRRAR